MKFGKFLWSNTKVYVYFCIIVVVVFQGIGSIVAGMTFRDIFPFYCIMAVLGLTLLIGNWRYYNHNNIGQDKDGSTKM